MISSDEEREDGRDKSSSSLNSSSKRSGSATNRNAEKAKGSSPHDEDARRQLGELEKIYQAAPIGLLFVDADLRYVRINERLAQINGKPAREHIGHTIREMIPDVAKIVEPLYRRVIETRQPVLNFEINAPVTRHPGSERFLVASYYPVVDGSMLLGISGVVQDITERKRAEIAIRASDNQLRLVIDSLPSLVSYIDRNFHYRFVNRCYEEWTGMPINKITGRTVEEAFGSTEFALRRPLMERALQGETVTFELSQRYRPDTAARYINFTYAPDRSEDGPVQGFVVLGSDVTERKRDREAVQKSEEGYRRIVETAAEGIWTVDGDGKTTFANKRLGRLLGYTPDELIGRSALDFIFDEDREDARRKFTAIQQDRLSPYDFRLRRRDGSAVWVNIAANPLRSEDGALLGVLGMFTDISERKRAEEGQKAVEKQLSLLVEASSALLASPESTDVLRTILDLAKRFIDADAYSVWRRPPEGGAWRIEASEGLGDTCDQFVTHNHSDIDGIRHGPIVVEDVENDPLVRTRLTACQAEGIRSLVSVPIRFQNDVKGTIVFYYRARHSFTELEVRVAAALGNLASAALGTAESYVREIRLRRLAESQERKALCSEGQRSARLLARL
jgi:PAS domain S-box-containing protein